MKKALILLITLFISGTVVAQYNYFHPEIFYMPPPGPEKYYADKLNNGISDNPGLQYRLHAGMNFNAISGFSTLTSWVSPKLLLPIGSRLAVEFGAVMSTTSLYGESEGVPERMNRLITYARGIYAVNQNLTVYGQFAKSLYSNPVSDKSDFESITMGMEYYITPNFSIGASVTSQKGFDPFYIGTPYRYGYSPYY